MPAWLLGADPQARESVVRRTWGRMVLLMCFDTHTTLQHQQRYPQLLIALQNSLLHPWATSLDCVQHAGIETEIKIILLDFLMEILSEEFLFLMIRHKEVQSNPEG